MVQSLSGSCFVPSNLKLEERTDVKKNNIVLKRKFREVQGYLPHQFNKCSAEICEGCQPRLQGPPGLVGLSHAN